MINRYHENGILLNFPTSCISSYISTKKNIGPEKSMAAETGTKFAKLDL